MQFGAGIHPREKNVVEEKGDLQGVQDRHAKV